ncbi:unnamed protein product [Fraxinus pennsylvanica]|uniref:Uncharacterized protein n=1 Tax=Fraxinus pennsylvanica TaxID=56036 RepID=A0AAD2DVV6_9LAMI|nr:unnamed protein product [Fraxinus pennsylvanica]
MASLSLHPLEHANPSLRQSFVDSESIEIKGVICRCEYQTDLKTSWIDTNPATRFFICGQQENSRGEIVCFGPPICDWSKEVIHGLLRSMRGLVQVNDLKLHLKGGADQDVQCAYQDVRSSNEKIRAGELVFCRKTKGEDWLENINTLFSDWSSNSIDYSERVWVLV